MEFPNGGIPVLALALLGVALLWALRLLHQPGKDRDTIITPLSIAGWSLIYVGVLGCCTVMLGPLSIVVWVAAIVVTLIVLARYTSNQRISLLWTIALAAEKGVPLHEAAQAFADERADSFGARAEKLAHRLEEGAALPAALQLSGHHLPVEADLAVRVGTATGQLSQALHSLLAHSSQQSQRLQNVFEKLLYLVLMLSVVFFNVIGFLIFMVPVLDAMFTDFGLELPLITRMVVMVSRHFTWASMLLAFLSALTIYGGCFYFFCLFTSGFELPGTSWIWRKFDGALIMHSLATAVRRNRSLFDSLELLSRVYPKASIRRRLNRVVAAMKEGGSWPQAFAKNGLARPTDAAMLESATANRNLCWALEETADRAIGRTAMRLNTVINIAYPVLLIVVAIAVAALAAAMFTPLVQLIEGLA